MSTKTGCRPLAPLAGRRDNKRPDHPTRQSADRLLSHECRDSVDAVSDLGVLDSLRCPHMVSLRPAFFDRRTRLQLFRHDPLGGAKRLSQNILVLFLPFFEIHAMLAFLINRRGGGMESEAGMEGAGRGCAQAAARRFWPDDAAGADFRLGPLRPEDRRRRGGEYLFAWIARNLLKSLESDERIQKNPRESKPSFLGFSWSGLVSAWTNLARGALCDRVRPDRLPGRAALAHRRPPTPGGEAEQDERGLPDGRGRGGSDGQEQRCEE